MPCTPGVRDHVLKPAQAIGNGREKRDRPLGLRPRACGRVFRPPGDEPIVFRPAGGFLVVQITNDQTSPAHAYLIEKRIVLDQLHRGQSADNNIRPGGGRLQAMLLGASSK